MVITGTEKDVKDLGQRLGLHYYNSVRKIKVFFSVLALSNYLMEKVAGKETG